MVVRIILGLVLIAVGSFSFYTVWAKPDYRWSLKHFDQASGVPKIVHRVLRGVVGLLLILIGMAGILKSLKLLHR